MNNIFIAFCFLSLSCAMLSFLSHSYVWCTFIVVVAIALCHYFRIICCIPAVWFQFNSHHWPPNQKKNKMHAHYHSARYLEMVMEKLPAELATDGMNCYCSLVCVCVLCLFMLPYIYIQEQYAKNQKPHIMQLYLAILFLIEHIMHLSDKSAKCKRYKLNLKWQYT